MMRRPPTAEVGLGLLFAGLAAVLAVYFAVMFGALFITAALADDDWIVTKTTKWSLVDRIAVALCEAERDDCYSDPRCGAVSGGMLTCSLAMMTEPFVWTLYRDRARKALGGTR